MIQQKNKAFTLVELIIVITILSILATIAFVSFSQYTKDARNSTKITTLKNLENGINGFQVKSWTLPSPDNSKTIQTWSLWQAWVLWDTATKLIWVNKKPTDPETWVEYTYSTYWNTYEIATAVSKSSSVWYTNTTYAWSEELKAKVEWSFNGYVIKYSSWGLNYYMTTPSITVSNPNVQLSVWLSTTGIVMNGGNNLPYTYAGVATNKVQNTTLFTPSILYAGASCGPQTYEEIIWFVDNLKLSLSGSTVDMTELNALKTSTDKLNFWLKLVNQAGWCDIKEPMIPDIYPVSCGIENGTFEWYPNNFDLTNSCLFQLSWSNGSAIVKDSIWKLNSKWLELTSLTNETQIELIYKTHLSVSSKISFDIKKSLTSFSNVQFYINWGMFYYWEWNYTWNDWLYHNIQSELLPPWDYIFKWEIFQWNGWAYGFENLYLDNIEFTCIWWGPDCGYNLLMENSTMNPFDLFIFTWTTLTPWQRVSWSWNVIEWTYALVSPPSWIQRTTKTIILNQSILNTSKKIKFNFRIQNSYNWIIKFYINWSQHIVRNSWDTWTSRNLDPYEFFESPLLAPGNYEFKWDITQWNGGWWGIFLQLYLDNIIIE